MALATVEIAFGYGGNSAPNQSTSAAFGGVRWNQSMASAGTTTLAAQAPQTGGFPCFRILASVDIYVAIGPNPNATTGPRFAFKAGQDDIYCAAGDKLAWVAA